jgi:hypothetical protein
MAILLVFGLDVFSIVTNMNNQNSKIMDKKKKLTKKRSKKPNQET